MKYNFLKILFVVFFVVKFVPVIDQASAAQETIGNNSKLCYVIQKYVEKIPDSASINEWPLDLSGADFSRPAWSDVYKKFSHQDIENFLASYDLLPNGVYGNNTGVFWSVSKSQMYKSWKEFALPDIEISLRENTIKIQEANIKFSIFRGAEIDMMRIKILEKQKLAISSHSKMPIPTYLNGNWIYFFKNASNGVFRPIGGGINVQGELIIFDKHVLLFETGETPRFVVEELFIANSTKSIDIDVNSPCYLIDRR